MVNDNIPLLSYIFLNYDIDLINQIISWFLNVENMNYNSNKKYLKITNNKKTQRIIFDMMKEMDINIQDIRVEKDIDGNVTEIYTMHKLANENLKEIPLSEESSGTKKIFEILPLALSCLQYGKLLLADEMDAMLHPKLLEYIIKLFTNPNINKHGAQLLFTSQDIYTMNSSNFRRDEIWFCALNKDNSSNLYPLSTFKKSNGSKPRNDETYSKQYIKGRYGADPYLRKILDWEAIYES